MRFAAFATAAAAAVAIPLAVQAAGPQMSGDAFVEAVRCTAYERVLDPQKDVGAERMRLNAEAARQESAVAQRAHNEVNAIGHRAATVANASDVAMMRAEQAAACAGHASDRNA